MSRPRVNHAAKGASSRPDAAFQAVSNRLKRAASAGVGQATSERTPFCQAPTRACPSKVRARPAALGSRSGVSRQDEPPVVQRPCQSRGSSGL